MESMNKFKVLTIIIICLFMFAIAAMYINTKDATEGKAQTSSQNNSGYQDRARNKEKLDFADVMLEMESIQQRVEMLEARGGGSQERGNSGGNELRCKIYGVKTLRGIEQISPTAAVQDAQVNGNDIVITCSL